MKKPRRKRKIYAITLNPKIVSEYDKITKNRSRSIERMMKKAIKGDVRC